MRSFWPTRFAVVAVAWIMVPSATYANQSPVVTYVWAHQRPGTQIVDVSYNVTDPDGDQLTIQLFLSIDGGPTFSLPCVSATGAIGSGIHPGNGKSIFWNAGRDAPGLEGASYALRVVADDGHSAPEGFVLVPPGTFTMGSPAGEPGRYANETQHVVTLTRSLWMSKYEVSEAWWAAVMGSGPQSQLPKDYVSWDLAVQFCNTLSVQEGLVPAYTINGTNGSVTWQRTANGYRLPTEAEWEYACRAGATAAFSNNTNCLSSTTEANYNGSPLPGCLAGISRGVRTAVGSFPANDYGLCDMHGNLYEWTWDGYRSDYQNLQQVDPVNDVGLGVGRVIRGGDWGGYARYCRSARRDGVTPSDARNSYGFRPVRWCD